MSGKVNGWKKTHTEKKENTLTVKEKSIDLSQIDTQNTQNQLTSGYRTQTSSQVIKNITNHGWSWRPPTVMNASDVTFSQEFYNNTSKRWEFRKWIRYKWKRI